MDFPKWFFLSGISNKLVVWRVYCLLNVTWTSYTVNIFKKNPQETLFSYDWKGLRTSYPYRYVHLPFLNTRTRPNLREVFLHLFTLVDSKRIPINPTKFISYKPVLIISSLSRNMIKRNLATFCNNSLSSPL